MLVTVLFPINAAAFTYRVPEQFESVARPGVLVRAPFRKGEKTGIITGTASPPAKGELKSIEAVLDSEPLLTDNLLKLLQWIGHYYISTSGLALKNAVPSGIFEGKKGGIPRITYGNDTNTVSDLMLTPEQKKALKAINSVRSGAFLLHGVTGSGKTEVYLRAIEAMGDKESIVLVPEIALTGQMIDRFRGRFGDRVSFLHSGLSPGEKLSQWNKMRKSEVRVAIGVRSAVFAPFRNLGLIVVDEEHEASYKQFEGLRYNARDVALARAKIEGIRIILGSATPSIESFYNAKKGKVHYIRLKNRIEQKPLPEVEIIDMTAEEKTTWSFSNKFLNAVRENTSKGRQSLLMLNRRGYSPFLICTDCGFTHKCPACSITLTYHKDKKTLQCHYCNACMRPRDLCPKCGGTRTKSMGAGTQRAEEELRSFIEGLSLIRMDRDTTGRKLSHYRIIKDMEQKKIDVLLGTQMVAKGHDFPRVALSGVIMADVALNLPDFRSSERTFQLFTQLAGRAGRGEVPGMAYIQTYEPEHYVFDFVRRHDYEGFYRKEIELRKELSYPPFSRLVRILFSFKTRDAAEKTMKGITDRMHKTFGEGIEILGPSPAPIEKIRNRWRWHVILKGKRAKPLRGKAVAILESIRDMKGVKVDIDVDPISMM